MGPIGKVVFLAANVPWFGSHSGEAAMLPHLAKLSKLEAIIPKNTLMRRLIGKMYSTCRGWPPRNQSLACSELAARLKWRNAPNTVLHLLRSEGHMEFIRQWEVCPRSLVSTIHLPVALWAEDYRRTVACMSSAIVYFTSELERIGSLMAEPNVKFVYDGVDTDFFKPYAAKVQTPPRILYSGVYLRNEPMLVRMVKRLAENMPDVRFDLLVPLHHRSSPRLAALLNHPTVSWHAGLNDEELRALYQRASLMLLPMNESGANTAVVEALASGLPLATTDVGGIRDYGGGSIYPIVANNDDDSMIALVEQYLARPSWRDNMSRKCRQFAEENLAWPLVAQQHLQAYHDLTSGV